MLFKVLKRDLPSLYNIRNAVLMDDTVMTDPVEMGKIVETAVYKHIVSYYRQNALSIGYYRESTKGKEIDVVVEQMHQKPVCIEIKYREGAPIADNDAIAALHQESSCAIVVTKNASDFGLHHTKEGEPLLRIPAFMFLYLLGHAEKYHSNLFA